MGANAGIGSRVLPVKPELQNGSARRTGLTALQEYPAQHGRAKESRGSQSRELG